MKEDHGIGETPEKWSMRHLLTSYDEAHRKGTKFNDTHVRETFLVRKDLHDLLNEFCKKRYGFKTKFINLALEKCLHEMFDEAEPVSPEGEHTHTTKDELTLVEVKEEVLAACNRYNVPDELGSSILNHVLDELLPGGADVTTLYSVKYGKFVSPPQGNKKICTYVTARNAVMKYVKYLSENPDRIK